MNKSTNYEEELTSLEDVGLLMKWFQLLRLHLVRRGLRYAALWTSDLIVRLIRGASPTRFSKITDGLHVGGQYLARGWRQLEKRGINAVINMRIEFDDFEAGIAPENYLHLPTIDNTPPTLKDLKQGIDFIHQVLKDGGQVYIHCEAGVGRAPTMAAAYLVSQGMKPAAAWNMLRARRPFIRPTMSQIKQVADFALDESLHQRERAA